MAFELNEQKVIAQKQVFKFDTLVLRDVNGQKQAEVVFKIMDETGTQIGVDSLKYDGDSFNTFWTNFNSGTFLYQELALKLNSQVAPNSLESEFVNVMEQPIEEASLPQEE